MSCVLKAIYPFLTYSGELIFHVITRELVLSYIKVRSLNTLGALGLLEHWPGKYVHTDQP